MPWATLLFLLMYGAVRAQERYLLEVRIRRYANPTHIRGVDEQCCDPNDDRSRFQRCQNECDNSLEFCFRSLDSPTPLSLALNGGTCPLGLFTTGLVGSDNPDELEYDVDFVGMIGSAPNPLPVQGSTPWPGGFQLYTKITDMDPGEDDLVDIIVANVTNLFPGTSFTPRLAYAGEFRFGFIHLSYRVTCTGPYFGPKCSTFCDIEGCSPERATCPSQGQCACLPGYRGPSCSETSMSLAPKPEPSTSGEPIITRSNAPQVPRSPLPPSPTLSPPVVMATDSPGNDLDNPATIVGITVALPFFFMVIILILVILIVLCCKVRSKTVQEELHENVAYGAAISSGPELEKNPAYGAFGFGRI